MDRFTALTVFRHAVELGSFAAVARHLHLSAAAVSKNINELEAHLGVRLLNRTTRRMSLTEAGRHYYERVARVLEDLAEADRALGPLQSVPRGVLRVSAPVTLTLMCLSAVVPRFLAQYPDLSLDLSMNDRRVNLVEEGFDMAIRGSDNLEDSSLIARRLMTLDHVVCGAPAYFARAGVPRTPDELAAHEHVQFTLSDHAAEWRFTRGEHVARVPVRARYRASSSLAVRDALRAGFGLSLIPRVYVAGDLAEGRLRAVLDDWSANETGVYAVYPSRRYLDAKVRAFLDFLVAETGGATTL